MSFIPEPSSLEVSERNGHPSGAFSSHSGKLRKLRAHNQLAAEFQNLNHPHIFLSVVNFLSHLNNFNSLLVASVLLLFPFDYLHTSWYEDVFRNCAVRILIHSDRCLVISSLANQTLIFSFSNMEHSLHLFIFE